MLETTKSDYSSSLDPARQVGYFNSAYGSSKYIKNMFKQYLVRMLSAGTDEAEVKQQFKTGGIDEAKRFIENSEYEFYEVWERELDKPIIIVESKK